MRSELLPYFIISQIHFLTCFSPAVLHSLSLDFSSQQGFHSWCGKVGQKVGHVGFCAVQPLAATRSGHYLTSFLGIIQHLSTCISLISRIFPRFQDLSSNQDLHLLLSGHLLLGTLLFRTTSRFQNLRDPCFAINGLCAEALYLISLLTDGSVLHLFINCGIQDVPLLFRSGVFKIYNHLKPVASSR